MVSIFDQKRLKQQMDNKLHAEMIKEKKKNSKSRPKQSIFRDLEK